MKRLSGLLAAITVLVLSSCATPGPVVQESEFKNIKRVAVVGFTSLSEVPDPMKNMMPAMPSGSHMGNMASTIPNLNTFAKQTDSAAKILQQFMMDIGDKMNWKFKSVDQVIDQDAYGEIYTNSMKNWKNMMTPDRAYQIQFVKNVLPVSISKDFTQQVRDHLIEALKVDALIEVQYKNSFEKSGFKISGIGANHLQSNMMMRVYKKGVAAPIWDDQNVKGPETNEGFNHSISNYNTSQEPELMSLYEKSAQLANITLMNRKDKIEK